MTPQDHNKTLGIIYAFLGGILTVGALVGLVSLIAVKGAFSRIQSDTGLQTLIVIGLILTVYFLLVAYGLLKRRPWVRLPALILSGLLVWLFPLGTALAIYNWWFLHSEGAKRLFERPPS